MAPLRSSRSTRNQEHNPAARNRGGVVDLDPTEGLPVRKWERVTVRVNQDASTDLAEANAQNPDNVDDFPWPEQSLPSFISQIPVHNQDLIRRARMGDRNARPSTWDPKTKDWIPAHEMDARNARLKSKHLINPDSPNSRDEEEDGNDEEYDDPFEADEQPGKRRKANSGTHDRTFETKKWARIPAAIAEKLPEPKYLADRRPGMESLYGGAYKATNGFGLLGPNLAAGSGALGYDLGDGSGLGNAAGVLENNSASVPEPTPVRKNMPPKRKKKKLGGPGRKKANPNPTDPNGLAIESGDVTTGENGEAAMADTIAGDTQNGEQEASGSDSEGEGSEEGEIEEGPKSQGEAPVEPAPEPQPGRAPEADPEPEPEPKPVMEPAVEPEPKPIMEPAVEPEAEPTVAEETTAEEAVTAIEQEPAAATVAVVEVEAEASAGEVDLLGGLEAAVEREQEEGQGQGQEQEQGQELGQEQEALAPPEPEPEQEQEHEAV